MLNLAFGRANYVIFIRTLYYKVSYFNDYLLSINIKVLLYNIFSRFYNEQVEKKKIRSRLKIIEYFTI